MDYTTLARKRYKLRTGVAVGVGIGVVGGGISGAIIIANNQSKIEKNYDKLKKTLYDNGNKINNLTNDYDNIVQQNLNNLKIIERELTTQYDNQKQQLVDEWEQMKKQIMDEYEFKLKEHADNLNGEEQELVKEQEQRVSQLDAYYAKQIKDMKTMTEQQIEEARKQSLADAQQLLSKLHTGNQQFTDTMTKMYDTKQPYRIELETGVKNDWLHTDKYEDVNAIGSFMFNSFNLDISNNKLNELLEKIISIGQVSFSSIKLKNQEHLTSIKLPNVRSIGNRAFYGSMSYIKEIYAPKATLIEDEAFATKTYTSKFNFNTPSTHITLPSKFNTDDEKDRIFGHSSQYNYETKEYNTHNWDKITFTWI